MFVACGGVGVSNIVVIVVSGVLGLVTGESVFCVLHVARRSSHQQIPSEICLEKDERNHCPTHCTYGV